MYCAGRWGGAARSVCRVNTFIAYTAPGTLNGAVVVNNVSAADVRVSIFRRTERRCQHVASDKGLN